jgi:iron uptake system EfeUOB component EfeO/EfeM
VRGRRARRVRGLERHEDDRLDGGSCPRADVRAHRRRLHAREREGGGGRREDRRVQPGEHEDRRDRAQERRRGHHGRAREPRPGALVGFHPGPEAGRVHPELHVRERAAQQRQAHGDGDGLGDEADDALLTAAVADYGDYAAKETGELVASTKRFTAALRAGDAARAKELFGPTRFHYEAVEPIAESFGDLDAEIDARVNDVPDRSKWTGFHRIEQTLWRDDTTKGTSRYATELQRDVDELDAKVGDLELQPAQIADGAVGLLDEVSASKITGEEDRYSHTDLSDFAANVAGARAAFDALKPVLAEEGDGKLVAQIDDRMAAVEQGIHRYKRDVPLGYATYAALTPADRRQLAQQVTSLAEPLSQMAGKVLSG